jgi:hypothetical protein
MIRPSPGNVFSPANRVLGALFGQNRIEVHGRTAIYETYGRISVDAAVIVRLFRRCRWN